jgi:hypothetical protein
MPAVSINSFQGNYMNRIILATLFILLFCAMESMAQFIPGKKTERTNTDVPAQAARTKSGSIENSLKSSLFIIQQNYQLKDITAKKMILIGKDKLYGKDGKPNFGTVYTFGVKTANGFYSNSKVVLPWLYDPDFEEYKRSAQYVPVISETNYSKWEGRVYEELKYSPKQIVSEGDSLVFVGSNMFGKVGMNPDPASGKKNGWFVWILLDEEAGADAFSFEIVAAEHNFDSRNTASEITNVPVSHKTIEGGLFVTERTTELGQIALDVSGLLFKKGDQWYIKQPVADKTKGGATNTSDRKGLTPAN